MSTLILSPDETEGQDTYLNYSDPDTAYGSVNGLFMYQNTYGRILIKFDLSEIPETSLCSSAIMSLWNISAGTSGPATWYVYSILSANSGWTQSGATWNKKDGTNNWAGSAGCSTAGTDYNSSSIGSVVWRITDNNERQISLDTTTVKSWFGTTNQNYGILIMSDSSNPLYTGNAYSCEDYPSLPTKVPKLVVNYEYNTNQRKTLSALATRIGSRQAHI